MCPELGERRRGGLVAERERALGELLERDADRLARACHALARAFARGATLFACGEGGAATDAARVAVEFMHPVIVGKRALPAPAVSGDAATVTAVGNDVGFERVFGRQKIALGGPRDIAVGISTSGACRNVLAGLGEAHRRGLLTCALTGYDGGRPAELPWLDHLCVVRSQDIPRLQEAHATIYHLIVEELG